QATDAPAALAGVDHEGHDPDDPVRMLEARQGVDRDEAKHLTAVVRDDHPGMLRVEAGEALDDVARAGWIALIGEQGGDALRILGRRRAERDGRSIGHGGDGTAGRSTRIRCWPVSVPGRTRTDRPNGPVATRLRGTFAAAALARTTSSPNGASRYVPTCASPWRASAAASRPSVDGSARATDCPSSFVSTRTRAPSSGSSTVSSASTTLGSAVVPSVRKSARRRSRSTVDEISAIVRR